ncbi:winged helix-turn-helix transcriptional regulator [Priestia megaterium]|uniref:winged helix-turn-helix transcriptional regulator n=1 Tax=Priestia megaterium TaxID=1404 RepID=UPI002116D385|nr:winged helix-turn-helix transcriptional regulator [Priestia megaterium]
MINGLVIIVGRLSEVTKRFNKLRHLIGGISQQIPTLTLCCLEEEGIVSWTAFPTIPPELIMNLRPTGTH